MSRVSSKSGLSPSATGRNFDLSKDNGRAFNLGKDNGRAFDLGKDNGRAFDLGKDSDIDMGRKMQPSFTSGGIGITQEVIEAGGLSITGGVSVDVSPLRLDVSAENDFEDPTKSTISIAGNAEIPGGLLGVGGGVIINTSTGEVVGGSISGEVGGVGVEVSSKEGELGLTLSYQIPFTPVTLRIGIGKKKKETPTPTPTPTPGTEEVEIPTPINKILLPGEPRIPPWEPPPIQDPIIKPGIETTGSPKFCEVTIVINSTRKWMTDWGAYKFGEIITKETKIKDYSFSYEGKLQHWNLTEPDYNRWNYTQTSSASGSATKPYSYRQGSGYYHYTRATAGNPSVYCYVIQVLNGSGSAGTSGYYGINLSGNEIAIIDFISRATQRKEKRPYFHWYNGAEIMLDVPTILRGDGSDTPSSYGSGNQTFYPNPTSKSFDITTYTYTVIDSSCFLPELQPTSPTTPIPQNFPPFPNLPPRKENMDECCRDSVKLLRAIYKGLGIAKFPGKLPATIIQTVEEEGEAPAEPAQIPIADFVDLLDWQFRRDDERWGQWEVQINVKDADITKEGDQGKQIKFPNLAESIAELEGQMLSVMANVDALVAIATKNLIESGMARQEAIKGYLAAKSIIKYMAFKSTEIDVAVPMTFTPGSQSISALIQESEGHIKGTDYAEKETLRDIFLDLLQAAAVIRAVHWQKIDSKTDTKTQLLNLLKGTVDLAELVSSPKKPTNGEEKKFDPAQNFEDFIDNVEDGFRNTTGITDIQNPYGKTPDRRPRIRQIGDNISQAGGDN